MAFPSQLDSGFLSPHNLVSLLLTNTARREKRSDEFSETGPARASQQATLFKNETADKCGRLMKRNRGNKSHDALFAACSNHQTLHTD